MTDEELTNPISGDQSIPLKDLSKQEITSHDRENKEVKKNTFTYYLGLALAMICLVFFGLFFGIYMRGKNTPVVLPEPVPTPTPTVEVAEATSASTMDVIKRKTGTLENKLQNIDLNNDGQLPPQLDYNIQEILDSLEE